MRILILLAIGLLLFVIFRNLLRKVKRERDASASTREEQMVRCQQCGLHLLPQEAVRKDQQYFCSQEHLEDFQKQS